MNRALLLLCAAVLAFIAIPVLFAAQANTSDSSRPVAAKHARAPKAATPPQSEGERIFQRNCARCHAVPEGFSPSISGTIVRHMRIRANLSEHDERELLRFFNP